MALPLITVSDYTQFTGQSLSPEDTLQVESIIRIASARLRAAVPGLDDALMADTLDRDLVTGVMVEVVAVAFDTLQVGLRVKSVQYPEWSTEYTGGGLANLVSFTPEQIALLTPVVETNAFSIRIGLT